MGVTAFKGDFSPKFKWCGEVAKSRQHRLRQKKPTKFVGSVVI